MSIFVVSVSITTQHFYQFFIDNVLYNCFYFFWALLLAADTSLYVVYMFTRHITPGTGSYGYSGDGGAATSASLYYPRGVALDITGNLYIADRYNDRIRKVSITGVITTIAGTKYCMQ